MSEPTLNDPENQRGADAFASALGRLAPAASGLDRDRLMFLAGVRSRDRAQSRRWTTHAWPIVAGLLALVVAGESALLARPGEPRVIERVIVVHEPAVQPPAPPAAPAAERDQGAAPNVVDNTNAPAEPSSAGFLSGLFQPGPALERYRRLQDLALQLKLDVDSETVPYGPPPSPIRAPLAPDAVQPFSEGLRRGDIEKFLPHGELAWPQFFSL